MLNKEKSTKNIISKGWKKYLCFFTHGYHSMTVVKGASFAVSLRNTLFSSQKSYRKRSVLSSAEKGSHSKASGLQYLHMHFFGFYFENRNMPEVLSSICWVQRLLVTIYSWLQFFVFFFSFSTMFSDVHWNIFNIIPINSSADTNIRPSFIEKY